MKAEKDFNPPCWRLYILRCSGGSFYTGITTDIAKRIKVHNSGKEQNIRGDEHPWSWCTSKIVSQRLVRGGGNWN